MASRERTPYEQFSHWFRRAIRRRTIAVAVAVLPRIYIAYMRFVFATSRVRENNFRELHEIAWEYDGAVALLWHEEVFSVAYGYYRMNLRGHTLASHGDAGSVITRMLELCGYVVFRGGSSSKRSRRDTGVVKAMIEHMNAEHEVIYGLTVDGSQGPAYRMKIGGLMIAQRCDKPIVLGRTWYRRSIRLKTWDRTAIPLPFNEIAYYLRGPYFLPDDADTQEGLEAFRLRLEDDLIDVARQSYLELGQQPPPNLIKQSEEPTPIASEPT